SLITRAGKCGVHAFGEVPAEYLSGLGSNLAITLRVSVSHVGKAFAELVIIRAHQGILPLQIYVIFNEHQRTLLVFEIDPSGGVGEDNGANAHATEDANRERNLLGGVALVKMNAALHGDEGVFHDIAANQLSC